MTLNSFQASMAILMFFRKEWISVDICFREGWGNVIRGRRMKDRV